MIHDQEQEALDRSLEQRRITWGPVAALSRLSTFQALQYQDFLLIWLGQAGNSAGQWMDQITRGWLMYELTGSPFALGSVSAARAVPMLLLSVIAGALADRSGRKRQLIVAQATNALLNWGLALLVLTGQVQPWHIYLTAVLAGAVQAFQQPARQSMISDIVPRRHIVNAVALNSMVLNSSRSIGPAVAGAVISVAGPGGSYLLQGFMYAIASLWTVQIQEPAHGIGSGQRHRPNEVESQQEGVVRSAVLGMRYVWRDQIVRGVILLVLVPQLLGQPYTSLMPVFAKDVLQVGSSGQGLLLTAAGIGALVGAVAVATVGSRGHQGLLMLTGAMVFGLSIFAFAHSTSFPLSMGLMALNGLFGVTYATQAQSILQTYTPPELRGRVMGVYLMNRGLAPLGTLLAGTLATALDAPRAVELMGGMCALLAFGELVLRPHVRQLH